MVRCWMKERERAIRREEGRVDEEGVGETAA